MYGLYRGNEKRGFKIQPNKFLNILMSRHISRYTKGREGKRSGVGEATRNAKRVCARSWETEKGKEIVRWRGRDGRSVRVRAARTPFGRSQGFSEWLREDTFRR